MCEIGTVLKVGHTRVMELSCVIEKWPIRGAFTISRGSKTEAVVVHVTIREGEYEGHGEGVPYARYGETAESVKKQIESVKGSVESRDQLQGLLPAGAARNAIDCALWDLEAKKSGKSIWGLVGIGSESKLTAYTISLDTPEKMGEIARGAAEQYQLLKIKLGGEGDVERLRKVREAVPSTRLIVDANEGWNENNLEDMVRICESVGVELIEQPLAVGEDDALVRLTTSVKICADESAHTSEDFQKLVGRYSAVNIKLDKAGGLTEALKMTRAAKEVGLSVMVGCMVSTSLSMAPATVVAQYADYVDLDGPLLLEKDREPAIEYSSNAIAPTGSAVWG